MKKVSLLKRIACIGLIAVLGIGLYGCGKSELDKKADEKVKTDKKVTLNIFAAASLKISMDKILKEYESENPNVEVKLNTDGSDKLYNQIHEGAPCDIFISASNKWMQEAVKNNLVDEKDTSPFLNNEVVLIKNIKASSIKLNDLKDGRELCLGAESVPVGGYSKQYFEKTGQWDSIKKDASFEAKVTDVVKKVAEGARNYGVVYRTDANSEIKNKTIEVCEAIPKDSGIKVIYPIGIVKQTKQKEEAEKLIKYLREGKAKDILEDVGFVLVQ